MLSVKEVFKGVRAEEAKAGCEERRRAARSLVAEEAEAGCEERRRAARTMVGPSAQPSCRDIVIAVLFFATVFAVPRSSVTSHLPCEVDAWVSLGRKSLTHSTGGLAMARPANRAARRATEPRGQRGPPSSYHARGANPSHWMNVNRPCCDYTAQPT